MFFSLSVKGLGSLYLLDSVVIHDAKGNSENWVLQVNHPIKLFFPPGLSSVWRLKADCVFQGFQNFTGAELSCEVLSC